MALPTRQPLEDILRAARHAWAGVNRLADGYAAQLQQANVRAGLVLEIAEQLRGYRVPLNACRTAPGMADYAKAQYADSGIDIVADFNAMFSAMDEVRDWIVANFPKDLVGGFLLRETIDATGHVTERTFTAAQVAPLVTRLQALSATIE